MDNMATHTSLLLYLNSYSSTDSLVSTSTMSDSATESSIATDHGKFPDVDLILSKKLISTPWASRAIRCGANEVNLLLAVFAGRSVDG